MTQEAWLVRIHSSGDCGLPVLVFGSADIFPVVDGLCVLHGDDALGDSGGMAAAPVHEPPGLV